jgi:hypothetical protein
MSEQTWDEQCERASNREVAARHSLDDESAKIARRGTPEERLSAACELHRHGRDLYAAAAIFRVDADRIADIAATWETT